MSRLSEFVGRPLMSPSTTVRGIVRQSAQTARVFLLTDSDFDSSWAIDLPLVDDHGNQYSHARVTSLLRSVVSREYTDTIPATRTEIRTSSITVLDGRAVMDSVTASDSFEDYVRVTLYGLVASDVSGSGGNSEFVFSGFLILDESIVRYYFDLPGRHVTIGIDGPLRTRANRGRSGGATFLRIRIRELFGTGIMESLRVPDRRDDYCQIIYDATAQL